MPRHVPRWTGSTVALMTASVGMPVWKVVTSCEVAAGRQGLPGRLRHVLVVADAASLGIWLLSHHATPPKKARSGVTS